jgi:hypothetical protein
MGKKKKARTQPEPQTRPAETTFALPSIPTVQAPPPPPQALADASGEVDELDNLMLLLFPNVAKARAEQRAKELAGQSSALPTIVRTAGVAAPITSASSIGGANAGANSVSEEDDARAPAVVSSSTRPLQGTSDADVRRRSQAGFLVDVEDAVRHQLALLMPGVRQGERVLGDDEEKAPFVVRGLSRRVPNDAYLAIQKERRMLMAQLGFVQRQRQALIEYNYMMAMGFDHYTHEMQLRVAEEYRRALSVFSPPRAITLLKPASEVRRLNTMWRTDLGETLISLALSYTSQTRDAMKWNVAERDAIATQLVARVVQPVLERRAAMLGTATFEDMPTTREQLRNYFGQYATTLLLRLATTQLQLAPAPAEEVARVDFLDEALRAPLGVDQESAVEIAYVVNIVALHANREYRAWFVDWQRVAQNEETLRPLLAPERGLVEQVGEAIDRLIANADDEARADAVHSSVPGQPVFYRLTYAPRLDEVLAGYRQLVNNEIALARNEAVVEKEKELVEALDNLLVAPAIGVEDFPAELLQTPTADMYAYLDRQTTRAEAVLSGGTNVQSAEGAAALARIRDNKLAIETAIASVAGPRSRPIGPHAANDVDPTLRYADPNKDNMRLFGALNTRAPENVADEWTSFDLTYPLDRRACKNAIPSLKVLVRNANDRYDAEQLHERANNLRAELDHNYADRVLQRDIAQLTYALEHVLSAEHDEALVVERLASDQARLELGIEIALAPQIEMRVRTTSVQNLSADDLAALRRRNAGNFEVRWFRLSREANVGEQEVRRTTLAPGMTRDVLELYEPDNANGGSFGLARALEVAGRYRVEVRDIDTNAVYRSLYEATIIVLARCPRDQKLFEPRSERAVFGECQWHEHAATDAHERFVEELRTLVQEGPESHQALVLQRTETEKFARRFGIAPSLFLPPWGTSDAVNLTVIARETDIDRDKRFSLAAVVQRFVKRFAATLRGGVASDDGNINDDEIFAVLASVQLAEKQPPEPLQSPEWRTDTLDTLPLIIMPVGTDRNKLDKILNNAVITRYRPKGTPPLLPTTAAVVVAAATTTNRLIVDWPLATLLQAFLLPISQALATVRERRYFARLRTLFGQFVARYRTERYEQITRPSTGSWRNDPLANRHVPAIDAEISRELAQLSATRVNVIARRWHAREFDSMLVDVDSRRELQQLLSKKVLNTLSGPGRAFGDRQTDWQGTHTVRTAQPAREYVSYIGGDQAPTRIIVHRGSAPLNFNYDYDGLHARAQHLAFEYERDTNRDDAWRARQRAAIERVVLIYNYFAFIAPPEKKFVTYEEIEAGIRSGRWGALSFAPELTK